MKQRISGKKIYAIRYAISMIFMAIVCLAVGFGLVGCGPTDTETVPKLLEGDSVTIEEKWDSRLISETEADTFWIKTNVRSDTAGAADKAGAIFIDYGSTAVYLTVAGGDDASNARVFFMARQDGETISMRAYDTAATGFEGVNHKINLETIWTGSAFYVGVNDVWTKIDAHTSAAVSEGTFDFFATGAHRFGVASTKATAYHEKIASSTDIATRLGEIEFSLELDVQDGGVAQLSATTVLLGNSVCLTVTTDMENVVRNTPVVVFNEATLKGVENGGIFTYEFMPKASGTISVQFQKAYKVTGTFGYAEGLYAEGDEVTLSGAAGTITDKSYEVWLPEGEQTITLVSERFADVTATVTVSADGENTAENVTFTELKFIGNDTTSDGGFVISKDKEYKPFAGITTKNFKITGKLYSYGSWHTTGLAFKNGEDIVRIMPVPIGDKLNVLFLQDGVWGNDQYPWTDGYYPTNMTCVKEDGKDYYVFTVTLIAKDGEYYVSVENGVNTSYIRLTKDTVLYGEDGTAKEANLREWLWDKDAEKTVGITAWEGLTDGQQFKISDIAYNLSESEITNAIEKMYTTVTLPAETTGATVTFADGTKQARVLKGGSVTVRVTPDTSDPMRRYTVESVKYGGETFTGTADGDDLVYSIPVAPEGGEIQVSLVVAYKVTGTFGYAERLYAEGDEVTLSGIAGTITGKSYEVWLPEGEQTITLVSERFADVTATVTVSADGENTAENVTFTELKFADGTVTSNGKVTETTRSFHPFAGVSAKDFMMSVTVGGGKNRGIVIKDASDAEPLYVYVKNSGGKALLGFGVNREPWEIAYTLGVDYQDENTLTMIRKEGVYYVAVNSGSWLKITADTVVAEGDKGWFFGATGWIFSDTEKTFGVGCWNESNAGEIKNIAYSLNPTIPTENIITAAFSDGSCVVDGNYNLNSYKQFAGVDATQFVVSVTSKSYTQNNFGTLSAGIGIQKSGTWDTVQIVLQKNDNGKVNVVMYDCGSYSTYTFITDADWKEDEEGGNRITLIQKEGTLYIRANEGSYFKITEFADDCSGLGWILSLGTDCGFGIVPLDGAQFGEAGSVAVSGIEYSVDADTVTKAVTDAEGNLYLGA